VPRRQAHHERHPERRGSGSLCPSHGAYQRMGATCTHWPSRRAERVTPHAHDLSALVSHW
jgi:hypothetical protein